MITLLTFGTILYFVLTTAAAMKIGNWALHKLDWDEVGIALTMMLFFWFIPITAAMDLGWIK
jgi:hypothetical protein